MARRPPTAGGTAWTWATVGDFVNEVSEASVYDGVVHDLFGIWRIPGRWS